MKYKVVVVAVKNYNDYIFDPSSVITEKQRRKADFMFVDPEKAYDIVKKAFLGHT